MLYDTSFLIDNQREQKHEKLGPARNFLLNHRESQLLTSVVCAIEFGSGFESTSFDKYTKMMSPFRILPLEPAIAWNAGQLRRQLNQRGQLIGDNDTLIAATAIHHAVPLVTRNAKHFEAVEGLMVLGY